MILQTLLSFFLELDSHLSLLIQNYGMLVYPLLFLVIFAETGLVIAPFLPGDSLLFAAGTLAAIGSMNIFLLFIVIAIAAILGDTVNYLIGYSLGSKVFKENSRFFKKEYLIKTQNFYEIYGAKTIVLARFIPIIRTLAPFVAGIGKMRYSKFISYNIIGGLVWVFLFLFAGYFLGSLNFVKDNLSIFLIIIIFVSLLPIPIDYFLRKRKERKLLRGY
jgi:membrane-associated protein